jgi:hypothetical protein
MRRLINSDSTVTAVESYYPEAGGDLFRETLGICRATRCNAPEDIPHFHRRENIPEDRILRPYKIVSVINEIIKP